MSTKYGTGNSLADQLKIVAKLISGGLKTPVYMVSLGGFDTHSNQVDTTDTSNGTHATLMQKLSDGIAAFQDDLNLLGISDRVVGMTFSEFGRRIQSNAALVMGLLSDAFTTVPRSERSIFIFTSAVLDFVPSTVTCTLP